MRGTTVSPFLCGISSMVDRKMYIKGVMYEVRRVFLVYKK